MPSAPLSLAQTPAFLRGAGQHAAGDHWDAHETWEALWRSEDDPERRLLLQALIQVAAGFHKLFVQGDATSSGRILSRALEKLEALPDACAGIGVSKLRVETRACCDALARGATLARTAFPVVTFASVDGG